MKENFFHFEIEIGGTEERPTLHVKNTKTGKMVMNYYYRKMEHLRTSLEHFKSTEIRKMNDREERAAAKKAARANFQNPYKVGQIFYDSWGYDQTNIDFYEVVEVKAKSVVIRAIAQTLRSDAGYSPMSGFVSPKKGEFIGEPMMKPIQIHVWDGKVTYGISSKHGHISEYQAGEKGKYCSWYA